MLEFCVGETVQVDYPASGGVGPVTWWGKFMRQQEGALILWSTHTHREVSVKCEYVSKVNN